MPLFKTRAPEAVLFLLWLGIQLAVFLMYGIHTDLEAEKYTGAATYLQQHGTLPAPKYIFYMVLILLIYFLKALGLGYGSVVVFQILINGIATFCLYRLAIQTTRNVNIARLTTLLFILFLPLQTWNVYLFTESLFISFTLLFTYLIFAYPPDNFKNFATGCAALAVLCLTRPSGLLFIVPFLLYSIWISGKAFRWIAAGMLLVGLVAFYVLINFVFTGGEDMDAMKPFREGHVICFIPDPAATRPRIVESGNPLRDIFHYIRHNPTHFFTLAYKRILSFFNLTRPYYSRTHNGALLLFMLPVYSLAVFSLVNYKTLLRHPVFVFITALLIFYALAVAFQCDDYHNRFTMPLFGFVLLLASTGFFNLARRIRNRFF